MVTAILMTGGYDLGTPGAGLGRVGKRLFKGWDGIAENGVFRDLKFVEGGYG